MIIGGVPEHFNLPWHLLLADDSLSGLGIAASWRDYPDGTGAMVADLNAGSLDLAVLLTEGAVAGLAKGGRYRVLSLYTESPLVWGIHVAPDSTFGDVAALATARFAISRPGSGSHLMCLALANAEGWNAGRLKFVVVGTLDGAVSSFQRHESDVFLWEKTMTQPVVARGDFQLLGEFTAPWPAFVICASEQFLERGHVDPTAVIKLVAQRAAQLALAAEGPSLIATRYGLNEADVRAWLASTRWIREPTDATEGQAAARAMLVQAGAITSNSA